MGFTPRLDAPSGTDKYWIQVGSGGYNKCIYISGSSVLPNCTGYAYGRFMEIMGTTTCNLSTRNAGLWYGNTGDGYQRGNVPKIGSVACWERPGEAGHVAVVEQVNTDGSIITSNSAYGGKRFYTQSLIPPGYTWSNKYVLQGFIYNPAVTNLTTVNSESKISKFIEEAKSHVGEGATWTWKTLGCGDIEWCCAFVMACAKTVGGIIDVIFPNVYSCTSLAEAGGNGTYGSKFIQGPRHGNNVKPQAGDMILFNRSGGGVYTSNHVGIVYEVHDNTVCTIEGNTSTWNKYTSKVSLKEYDYTESQINGYFRPDWSKVGSSVTDLSVCAVGGFGTLYSSKNTRADATIREVAYIKDYQFSTLKNDVRLSVINYTDVLSSFFSNGSFADYDVVTDGIEDTKAKAVIEYFLRKGLNSAAACGICSNIEHESVPPYNTASIGDNGTSFGICQWHNDRGAAMKKMVGSDWSNNLTGQLDYLWYELTNVPAFSSLFTALQSVPDTETGAKTAADKFVRLFEKPQDMDGQSVLRQESALSLFNKLVMKQASSSTLSSTASSTNLFVSGGTTISIPSDVTQSGITGNYTYYDRRWASSSVQKSLYDLWVKQGKPQKRKIATLDGYFLCALSPIFGTTGDIVTLILDDNTSINCIIGDSKGTDAQSKWGHLLSGKVDIVEWEALVSHPSEIDLSGWKGKTVKKVINRGAYMK